MRYFAKVVEGIVVNTIVTDGDSFEDYIEFSETEEFRYNPAVKGGLYNSQSDAFINPKPYTSWTLNQETFKWEAPVAKPQGPAAWDETNQVWNTPDEA
jgi:hypothetical protein